MESPACRCKRGIPIQAVLQEFQLRRREGLEQAIHMDQHLLPFRYLTEAQQGADRLHLDPIAQFGPEQDRPE